MATRNRAISEIKDRESSIDVVFNNAGVNTERWETSPQGRELHFEVNVLAPYVLANDLVSLITTSTVERIVNTSSNMALSARRFDPAALVNPASFQKLFGTYVQSKLALSLWTQQAVEQFSAHGVEIVSVDPGANSTPMTNGAGMPGWLRLLVPFLFKAPGTGARLLRDAAEMAVPNGSFISKGHARPLPFQDQAPAVMSLMDIEYRKDRLA